jgi:hypothetical protein
MMNRPCKILGLLLLGTAAAAPSRSVEGQVLSPARTSPVPPGLTKLEALGMIESGNNDAAVGGAGEVSRYQIKPRVWEQYSGSRAYRDLGMSSRVAERHLQSLEDYFRRRTGRAPTDFDRYVLWNAGPVYYRRAGFSSARVHRDIRQRATRYANLRQARIPRPATAVSTVRPPTASATATQAVKTVPLLALVELATPPLSTGDVLPLPALDAFPARARAWPIVAVPEVRAATGASAPTLFAFGGM